MCWLHHKPKGHKQEHLTQKTNNNKTQNNRNDDNNNQGVSSGVDIYDDNDDSVEMPTVLRMMKSNMVITMVLLVVIMGINIDNRDNQC